MFGVRRELSQLISLCPGFDETLSTLRLREMNHYNAGGMVALLALPSGTTTDCYNNNIIYDHTPQKLLHLGIIKQHS
jgi:hypothetical protein